jgi:uncharacterized protein
MHKIKRNVENSISYLMNKFPVVALLGARQVGKSILLKKIMVNKGNIFDLEREADFNRVNMDPELIFRENSTPLAFDEAQLCPKLFNAIRVEVDKNRKNGMILISGSSSLHLLKNITETLAGRCAVVEIHPFCWNEEFEVPQSEFFGALENPEKLKKLKPTLDHKKILECCLYGGYPDPFLNRGDKIYYDKWMEDYYRFYVEKDIRTLFPNLNFDAFRRFIKMLSFSTGEILNFSNFAKSLDISQPTVKNYLEILEGTFLWRKLPSYEKNLKKRIIKMPKGHLRDSGLINYLLNIHDVDSLKSHPQFGNIWETSIIEQILRGLSNNLIKHNFSYYRTSNHVEVDLVLEGRFKTIPVEIKSGFSVNPKDLKPLDNFIRENNCDFGILVNNGDEVVKLTEKIYQVPAIFL